MGKKNENFDFDGLKLPISCNELMCYIGETRASPACFGQIAPSQAAEGSFSLLIGMKRKLEHYTNDSPIYVFA